MKTVTVYADGGARGNPGPAGAGSVLYDESGAELAGLKKFLGKTTNNVAEYTGLIIGLEKAKELGFKRVHVRLDSELIIKQMKGIYRVRQPHLQVLHARIQELCQAFTHIDFQHVRREFNARADALANEAMDEGMKRS